MNDEERERARACEVLARLYDDPKDGVTAETDRNVAKSLCHTFIRRAEEIRKGEQS